MFPVVWQCVSMSQANKSNKTLPYPHVNSPDLCQPMYKLLIYFACMRESERERDCMLLRSLYLLQTAKMIRNSIWPTFSQELNRNGCNTAGWYATDCFLLNPLLKKLQTIIQTKNLSNIHIKAMNVKQITSKDLTKI